MPAPVIPGLAAGRLAVPRPLPAIWLSGTPDSRIMRRLAGGQIEQPPARPVRAHDRRPVSPPKNRSAAAATSGPTW